jgi:1,4-dihydroxy-2-naphthoate octaprenyltransferase
MTDRALLLSIFGCVIVCTAVIITGMSIRSDLLIILGFIALPVSILYTGSKYGG